MAEVNPQEIMVEWNFGMIDRVKRSWPNWIRVSQNQHDRMEFPNDRKD